MRGRISILVLFLLVSCGEETGHPRSMVILGIDGMEPRLFQKYLAEGRLPNFKRLMEKGEYQTLGTTLPPQSPVAWSTFITGGNPGLHGVYDFIHRHPALVGDDPLASVYRSTCRTEEGISIGLGSWAIPLGSGKVERLRRGMAFWEALADAGVPATLVRLPANFPPVSSGSRCLTGMDTPDLAGSAGTFTFFTTEEPDLIRSPGGKVNRIRPRRDGTKDIAIGSKWVTVRPERAGQVIVVEGDETEAGQPIVDGIRRVDGGRFVRVHVEGGKVEASLIGPPHRMRRGHGGRRQPDLEIPFKVWIDGESRCARIDVQDEILVLREGEWSDWVAVTFDVVPYLMGVSGICRFFLKEVDPEFKLYVSPINIDPMDPALPISIPKGFSREVAEAIGRYYTQEMPEDTKALTNAALTDDEYLELAHWVLEEELRQLDHFLEEFSGGLLFHYFSVLDQNSHVFWRAIDPDHPQYTPEFAEKYGSVLRDLYVAMDTALGKTMDRIGPDVALLVMSDHGFTSFRRSFHLNSWLRKEGYVVLHDGVPVGSDDYFLAVDWSRTRAYGLGLNGLYLNLKGRESGGIVEPGEEAGRILDEIREKLLAVVDPKTGRKAVSRVFRATEAYRGPAVPDAPDLIVGYAEDYRASWDTILGKFPEEIFVDNLDKWSGDHCIDPAIVPGVLFTDRPVRVEGPTLADMAPTVLSYFGVPVPEAMEGRDIFGGGE